MPLEERRDQGAERRQVVAALLDQHRGQPQPAHAAPRRGGSPSVVTRSGLSGSSAAASTPSETTTRAGTRTRATAHQRGDGIQPALVAGPRRQRHVAVRARARRRPRSRRRSRRSAGTSPRPGRRGPTRRARRRGRRRAPGCRCRGGRRRRRPPPASCPARRSACGRDGGVVEVAGTAVRRPGVAWWPGGRHSAYAAGLPGDDQVDRGQRARRRRRGPPPRCPGRPASSCRSSTGRRGAWIADRQPRRGRPSSIAARREDVGHDPVLAGVRRKSGPPPSRRSRRQVPQERASSWTADSTSSSWPAGRHDPVRRPRPARHAGSVARSGTSVPGRCGRRPRSRPPARAA